MLCYTFQKHDHAVQVFLVDCTGSMQPHIDETKVNISRIVDACIVKFKNQVIFSSWVELLLLRTLEYIKIMQVNSVDIKHEFFFQ